MKEKKTLVSDLTGDEADFNMRGVIESHQNAGKKAHKLAVDHNMVLNDSIFENLYNTGK
jgi:hypothetical protein